MGNQIIDVLLVEDNPHEAQLTIRSLKKHNLANNLHHVDDGAEALDFVFARGKYAERKVGTELKVILLDLKLPKVDGLEVLKYIKSDDRTRSIPVVILTSSKEEQDIITSYKLGVNSYIVKPVQFESFAQAVADLGMYWMFHNQVPGN
jgi:two-component system response regulator